MKPYPEYKNSGFEWLGEVPVAWELVAIKVPFSIVGGTTPKTDNPELWDGDISWITPADLSRLATRFLDKTTRQITQQGLNSCGLTVAEPGAIVLSTRAPIGSIAVTAVPACCNQGCRLLIPRRDGYAAYYYYTLLAAREQLNLLGRGSTFLELSGDQLGAFRVPLPPLPEQRAIADFLDHETAKIDALIEEQRRLIALLAEKRQATISHAVTRGLDPAVRLKPSGVEWLGDIPEGWEVVRFSQLVSITGGQVDPEIEPYASMILIAPNHIESGSGRLLEMQTAVEQGAESGKYHFDEGTVVYSKIRPALAKATRSPVAGLCSADMYPLTSKGRLDPDYLLAVLLTPGFTAWATMESDRVAMPKINREKLNELMLPVPPLMEQREIADRIAVSTHHLDTLTATATEAITLFQERRAALISAAVTGKIDVRGLAPGATPVLEPV